MKSIIRRVTLHKASRRADDSVAITFITDTEQSTKQLTELDEARKQGGALYFKPNGVLNEEEAKAIDNAGIKPEGKSKSQQLRGAVWATWKTKNDLGLTELTQEQYYNARMEHYKAIERDERELLNR